MIDFSGVKEEGKKLSWVGYGISENVVFSSINLGESSNGKPRIEMKIKFDGSDDSSSTNLYLYLSENAIPYTMKNILSIQKRLSSEAALRANSFADNAALVAFLSSQWIGDGKKFRIKLKGEEYVGTDKEGNPAVKIRVSVPYGDFIESMNPFSEAPAILAESDTKLKFSKGDKYDFQQLPDADIQTLGESPNTQSKADDLPF